MVLVETSLKQAVNTLAGKKSRYPNKGNIHTLKNRLRDIMAYVDDGDLKYVEYTARQLAKGPSNLKNEDLDRYKDTLQWFKNMIASPIVWGNIIKIQYLDNEHRQDTEIAREYSDINKFESWRELEKIKTGFDNIDTYVSEYNENYKLVYEATIAGHNFKAFLILEPEGFCQLGAGSTWCTSRATKNTPDTFTYPGWHPKRGQSRQTVEPFPEKHPGKYPSYITYFKDKTFIVLKDGLPYWQFGGKWWMNRFDARIVRTSIAEDYFLGTWQHAQPEIAPHKEINKVRGKLGLKDGATYKEYTAYIIYFKI